MGWGGMGCSGVGYGGVSIKVDQYVTPMLKRQ